MGVDQAGQSDQAPAIVLEAVKQDSHAVPLLVASEPRPKKTPYKNVYRYIT
jgi:hypothetical protein